MAEEKKESTSIGTATTIRDWVMAYYGDDAIDYSKKNKVRHSIRVCQFASVVAIVTKNSKKAHTDFFESSYTAVDTTYVKAAELIVRLIETKYRENRPLTMEDFKNCGGKDLFDGRPNFDAICEDYIGKGGMVEMGEMSFPSPKGQDLRREKESFKDFDKWLKESTDYEKDERALEKRRLMYGSMVDDLDDVKSDFEQLLQLASPEERNSGALNGKTLHEIYNAVTDKAAKMQRELKGKKSSLDFDVRDDIEAAVAIRYEAAKKTAKVAALGGVTAASLGAVVGGVFWPAFLVIPVYALAKKWLPDWAKSLGEMWGHFEKSLKTRYERQKVDSYYHYLVSFMETGGKPKIRFKDRFFLTKDVIKCLKKGAKSGSVGATYEDNDGITRKSEIDRAKETTSIAFGTYLKAKDKGDDQAVAIDKKTELYGKVEAIVPDNATFDQFIRLANRYEEYQASLDSDTKYTFQLNYAKKLGDSAVHLIFETPMESMSRFHDIVSKALADDGKIMTTMKDVESADSAGVERIKRLREFASKELAELNADEWKGKTFDEFIRRPAEPKMERTELVEGLDLTRDVHVENAISYIEHIKVNPKDFREVVSQEGEDGAIFTLNTIQQEIAQISNSDDKERVNTLLWSQIELVFKEASRRDTVEAYESVFNDEFTGRHAFSKIFDEIKDMSFGDIDSDKYSKLVEDLEKKSRVSPMAMGRYLRGKISKKAQDVFSYYLNAPGNQTKFRTDLPFLIEFLSKLNSTPLLNQQQKAALTKIATENVKDAFDKFAKNMSIDFVGNYDATKIRQYLQDDYASGGLKNLFVSDNSADTRDIENKLNSLRLGYGNVQETLKFNGKFDMSGRDKSIISTILLRDESDKFQKVRVRDSKDPLIDYLSNLKVSNSYSGATFVGADASNIVTRIKDDTNLPYAQLQKKLASIGNDPMTDEIKSWYDKYAAVVALKNKAICEFRECLVTIAYALGGTNIDVWLSTPAGRALYGQAIQAWTNGLFKDIDAKIEEYEKKLDSEYGIEKAILLSEKETKRYGGTYKLTLSEGTKELG